MVRVEIVFRIIYTEIGLWNEENKIKQISEEKETIDLGRRSKIPSKQDLRDPQWLKKFNVICPLVDAHPYQVGGVRYEQYMLGPGKNKIAISARLLYQ